MFQSFVRGCGVKVMKKDSYCNVKSPTRIDLSGGLLDIWPLYTIIEDCCTVNCSIPVFTSAEFKNRTSIFRFMTGESEAPGIKVKISSLSGVLEKSFLHLRDLLQDPAKEFLLLKKHIEYWSRKEKAFIQKNKSLKSFTAKDETQGYEEFCMDEKAGSYREDTKIKVKSFAEDQGEMYLYSESPIGAGLGASSSLCVSLAKAFALTMGYTLNQKALEFDKAPNTSIFRKKNLKHLSQNELLLICRDLETALLRAPAGFQDYIPAMDADLKSLYIIEYSPARPQWKKKQIPLEFFKDHLLLVDTKVSHHSGQNNWDILKKAIDQDPETLKALYQLRDNSLQTKKNCEEGNWLDLFSCLKKEQELRARFFPGWLNPGVSAVISLITEQGKPAVKLCGAGGGGFLIVLTKSKKQKQDLQSMCVKNNIPTIKL